MSSLTHITIERARQILDAREASSEDITRAAIAEIDRANPDINAFVEVFDDALESARVADRIIAQGRARALTGIPIAVKDNILINGKQVSCGSRILQGYRGTYDAGVVERLRAEHAVILGRTNMDEFAMGSSTETSAWGPTKNPHGKDRVPGGSSGGSAAAVVMGAVPAALGSDTGGSIRQPAALCGVVGLKPTYGAVSRRGLVAMASSLDQIGPFTRTVADTEIMFQVIAGRDGMDSTSAPDTVRDAWKTGDTRKGRPLRIGVPREFVKGEGMSHTTKDNFDATLAALVRDGYEVRDISLPHIGLSLAAYYILMPAEASTNLARFDGVRFGLHKDGTDLLGDYMETRGEGFGAEVRRRIMLGAYVLSSGYHDAFYGKAEAARRLISEEFARAFTDVDVIVTPTAPGPAWVIGEKRASPVEMYLADIFTVPANIAGIPAISVPSGMEDVDGEALPLGFQIMAPAWREDLLFRVGASVEKIATGAKK